MRIIVRARAQTRFEFAEDVRLERQTHHRLQQGEEEETPRPPRAGPVHSAAFGAAAVCAGEFQRVGGGEALAVMVAAGLVVVVGRVEGVGLREVAVAAVFVGPVVGVGVVGVGEGLVGEISRPSSRAAEEGVPGPVAGFVRYFAGLSGPRGGGRCVR